MGNDSRMKFSRLSLLTVLCLVAVVAPIVMDIDKLDGA